MAAWRRSSSAGSFMVPCTGTVRVSELLQPPLYALIHKSPCVCPRQGERPRCPFLSLGKCLPGDASPTLCACFPTRCKFFLFKMLTFSQLPISSSSFVQGLTQAGAVLQSEAGAGNPNVHQFHAGFSLEQGQDLGYIGGREAHPEPGTASLLFSFLVKKKNNNNKTTRFMRADVTPSDQIVGADSCRWMVFGWGTSRLSLPSCQFSQLYISPLCQPLFSSPLSLSPPCAIF